MGHVSISQLFLDRVDCDGRKIRGRRRRGQFRFSDFYRFLRIVFAIALRERELKRFVRVGSRTSRSFASIAIAFRVTEVSTGLA